MMGHLSSPGPARGVNGPYRLPLAANVAREQLAAWACNEATSSNDYEVNGQGDRTYRITSLEALVEPFLQEMNLTGCKYTMYRAEGIRLVCVNDQTFAIPINILAKTPGIRDLAQNKLTILLEHYYILRTDVIISPKIDYLLVEGGLGAHP